MGEPPDRLSGLVKATKSVALRLPEEVWEKIAQYMNIREWASVCGACRSMFHLQLKRAHICKDTPSAGIQWLFRRWSRLSLLCFDELSTSHLRLLANASNTSRCIPTQLMDLTVDLRQDTQECRVWLAWVLAQLQGLRYLSLSSWGGQLLWMPPLLQLRHLELIYHSTPEASIAELLQLTNLRTLLLRHSGGFDATTPVTDLDLRLLPHLQRACLYKFRCRRLHVAEHCCLHVDMNSAVSSIGTDWSGAWAAVRSVNWIEGEAVLATPLPAFLSSTQMLSQVDLNCGVVGSADTPLALQGALVSTTKLRIVAKSIHVWLPPGLVLEELVLRAFNVLCVVCRDPDAFLDGVGAFSMSGRYAEGTFMMDLCLAMADRGMEVDIKTLLGSGGHTQLQHLPDGAQALHFDCPCGCCRMCLAKAGLIHED